MGDEEAERPSKKARGSSPPPAMDSGGLTAFALRLAKKLAEGDDTRDSNIAFSPLSLYTTLGLVAAGARGKTLDELLALLGAASADEVARFVRGLVADPSGSGGPLITYAYGLFHQKHLKLTPAYLHSAAESYNAEIRAVDFAEGDTEKIRHEINDWAAATTNNLITEILPEGSLTDLSRFVLTNAIYFKGVWETQFPKDLTEDHEFHRLDGADPIEVPFMTLGAGKRKLFLSEEDDFQVLKLPYEGDESRGMQYSMCVFLPYERDGLRTMVDALPAADESLLDYIPDDRSEVRKLLLPKFKLSFFCSLTKVLKGLGLREAFTEEADLSGLVEKRVCDVRLDDVFHKAVVEVNEEGTAAAGCTAASGRVKQCARKPMEFVADHPFAFYIVEEVSGAVVFAGHVLDPSSSQ
ncbi:hypothetical protein VPH35_056349 [Triticum aestivum]|uniref:serpin-Z2A-like n=1 Tax=Triticum aestivum TaxID=4565 RepID=UPI00162BCD51|nr:serpin-Z2A-like [Triticum aestivum]